VNAYLLVPLLACVTCAMLSVAILARDTAHRASRLGAALALAAAWWALCEVLWSAADRAPAVLRLVRVSGLGWLTLGPIVFHLFLELTGRMRSRLGRCVPLAYLGALVLAGVDLWTPWLHPAVARSAWGWSYALGPAFWPAYALSAGLLVLGLALGIRDFWSSPSAGERRQARWLVVGMLVPLAIASVTDGLLPLLGRDFPRFGTASITILAFVIALGFQRHGYSLLAPGSFASEILAALPEGVALLRFDGSVRLANAGMARLTGFSEDELRDRSLRDLFEGVRVLECEERREHECMLRSASGEAIPVSLSTSTLHDKQGDGIGLVLVARDLSEVASLRSRLITSGRLAAVGQLAAGIAHEINNPVAFVHANLGGLRDLLGTLEGKLPAPVADGLRDVLREGCELVDESLDGVDRVAAIVRDVKSFSHAGSATRELVDLSPLLDSVLRVAGPELRRARVERSFAELPPVFGAPQELKQVFLNLVVNAAQACADGGSIRIVTGVEGGRVAVSVEDQGCGIPGELLERVFDPFFTTKPVGEGTGLGLSISYEIVRRHGGDMMVSSVPGSGTRVRVELPLAEAPEA